MSTSKSMRIPVSRLSRLIMILTILGIAASILYSGASQTASLSWNPGKARIEGRQEQQANPASNRSLRSSSLEALFVPQAGPSAETIATYAADCVTPKSTFALGETVCAVTTNAPINSPAFRSVTWGDSAGFVVERTDLTTVASTTFVLPTDQTSVVAGTTVDNRGTWRVSLVPFGRSVVRAAAYFTVKDPDNAATDLNVYNNAVTDDGNVPAGTNLTIRTVVTNFGPDDATGVVLTEEVPSNATFVSETQTGSFGFTCIDPAPGGTGTTSCTGGTIPKGSQAEFIFVYAINGTAPKGTLIASLAEADTTPSNELDSKDNKWTARAIVTENPGAPVCALGCPANITVNADSPAGTVVNFDVDASGDCGTTVASPASGSVFPIGSTVVSITSQQGGGSCSFMVTVVDTPAPTISCAADQTAQATGGQFEVAVDVDPPTSTGHNVTTTGVRSDNRPLSDPYPIGTTTITWTAAECNDSPLCEDPSNRTASCTQRIVVTGPDAPTISCPGDKTFNASGCNITLTTGQIGSPTATGSNVVITSRRSDDLSLTDPFPAGQTLITWTATDDTDRVASCVQKITITTNGSDTTPPVLTIPADLNVTTATCSALLDDELGVATATDACTSAVSITRTGVPMVACPIPGNPTRQCESFVFPVGTTNVTYTATDAAGNVATGVQHVTVHETTPPVFTFVPNNVGPVNNDPALCGAYIGDATLGAATVSDNCDTTVIRSGVPAGNIFPVGDTVVTYTAKADTSVTATQHVIVVDNTPPVVTAPGAVTLYTGPGATSCSVTVSNLDATLGTGSANDNCPGVSAVTRSGVPAGNTFPLGPTTVAYSATDAHGNTASANQVVTVVDNTAPVISCPANIVVYLPLNSTATSMAVTYPAVTATDNCSVPTIGSSPASGSVFPMGITTVNATATDAAGNSSSCSFTVTVLYDFTGFFSPVGNVPTLNSVNAGRAIPVKFSLSGYKGLNIFAAGSPYTVSLNCNTNDPGVDITETVTAGGSSLSFGGDQYNYTWKTESSWAGTCRQLIVTLNDGSVHVANFKFR